MAADQSSSQSGAGPAPAPVCFRHPDRETWVSCTRCERPICPDCMNPASVGFQCPDCVKEGNRGVREARTAFGGGVTGDGTVTKVLIAINVAVFLIGVLWEFAVGGPSGAMKALTGGRVTIHEWFAMSPYSLHGTDPRDLQIGGGVATGEWWRLVTAGFLHYGVLHLLLNMWALLLFGGEVERLIGRWRYVALYLLTGVGGTVTGLLLASSPFLSLAGASGSVFGLFGALVFFFRKLKRDPRQLLMLIALNFGLGFFIGNVSWQGHLGGLITGGLLGGVLAYAPQGKNRTAYQVAGLVVVMAILAAVAILGARQFIE